MKKGLILFVVLFGLLLSGCKQQYTTIQIDKNIYSIIYGWQLDNLTYNQSSEGFQRFSVMDEGTELHLIVSDSDTEKEFVYCENVGSLYHKDGLAIPENDIDDIEYIIFEFPDQSKTYTDDRIINEILEVVKQDANVNVLESDYVCAINIHYDDCPAYYTYGTIVKDDNQNYWIRTEEYDFRKDSFTQLYYYSIKSISPLIENCVI